MALNTAQTIALAYIAARWWRRNGHPTDEPPSVDALDRYASSSPRRRQR